MYFISYFFINMELNDSDDLIKFINKEKKHINELDFTHSYKLYCRSLPKIIILIYKKISLINIDIIDVIMTGCNMYYSVYWFILRYTNNCDVALFLSETSINLFLNSIISSYETLQDNPFKISPNIGDSVKFAYKKTIGPLQCSTPVNKDIDNPQLAGQIINMFITQIVKQIIMNNILPNNKRTQKNLEFKNTKVIEPKMEILLDFIQNQLKIMLQSIWHIIFFIVNKNSEDIADKLYYQITHYINNYSVNESNKPINISKLENEIEWEHRKQKQIIEMFNNIQSLIDTIKEYSDGL